MTAHIKPEINANRTDVWTAFSVAFLSPLPKFRATITLVPTEKPINTFTTRFINAPVVPIEPSAPSTFERLTIIMSAAE